MSLNFEQARHNMVEQQVRAWEVLDPNVLNVMEKEQREDFVPARYRKLAFADINIPIGGDEIMMKPNMEGRMLQALNLTSDDSVLEIGTGSGFITACLASLAGSVTSIEIEESYLSTARSRLARCNHSSVTLVHADVFGEWEPTNPLDAIVVTGAVPEIPERFKSWLKLGGRLFVIRGTPPAMEAVLLTREDADQWSTFSLFECELPYLKNALPTPTFFF